MLIVNLTKQTEMKQDENQLFEHGFDSESDSDEEVNKVLKLHKKGVI